MSDFAKLLLKNNSEVKWLNVPKTPNYVAYCNHTSVHKVTVTGTILNIRNYNTFNSIEFLVEIDNIEKFTIIDAEMASTCAVANIISSRKGKCKNYFYKPILFNNNNVIVTLTKNKTSLRLLFSILY